MGLQIGAVGIANMGFDNVRVTALPEPFLDLPWDYENEGLSFNEAALSINSFFDHQYPLLSAGLVLNEPATASANIVNYLGQTTTDSYTKHDGYDYGNPARARLGDPVLAAASGSATYINSCRSCGNMVIIDHGNGYQTRYIHLQSEGLITSTPNEPVEVGDREQIGRVGFSGNVRPNGENGAHIHFGVYQDENWDEDFDDNIPDGITDPYGWQSDSTDPWVNYVFNYLNQNRTGNKSRYLWRKKLASMTTKVTSDGNTVNVGNYTMNFPQNSTSQNINITAKSTPAVQSSDNIVSAGSTLFIKATNNAGNIINFLQNPFSIILNFSNLDLSKIKTDTLSLYSSVDGINWNKEDTTFSAATIAQTEIDHLSYFALMGERKDTTAPVTEPVLSGTESQPAWFNSDVELNLNTQDNTGGLGVYYTVYRINEGEEKIYESPLSFTDEGHYKIEYYSVDEDDNTEETKSIEFDIDKTPPRLSLDTSTHTLWPPNGKMVDVQIQGNASDNNGVTTSFQISDEYGLIQPQISNFGQKIQLEAKRKGDDLDGRIYTIEATAMDLAGNIATVSAQILAPHDQRKN